MPPGSLCAVVVTFHPDAAVLENLTALREQVDVLIVVDNGSSADELCGLRRSFGRNLVELGENRGIAAALNSGIHRAQTMGCAWAFLFDQDSRVTDGFVPTMLAGFAENPWGERLGILVPRYRDSRLGVAIPPNLVEEGLEAAMTSGSLIPLRLFARVGMFVEELFIDGVDYEFSLRVRAAGLVIAECAEAVLEHSPGEPRVVRFGGRRLYQTANYSPVRRYYQERNKIWIAKRYFRKFPVFCAKLFLFSVKDFVKILVAERDSARKARYFLHGVRDGVRERMGRLE